MKKSLFSVILVIFLIVSCKTEKENTELSEPSSSITDFDQLVKEWSKAHVSRDIGVLSELFDNTVLFYGTSLDKNSCLENKLSLFKRHSDFYQQIYGNVEIDHVNDTIVKTSFVKRVTFDQKTNDYPSYLTFTKKQNKWKISVEGDLVTDKNLSKKKDSKIPKDAIKGDFNGDGILDYAWLVSPKIDNEGEGCIGDCVSYIKFSDPNIPSIKISNCIGGIPDNLGDLNNNITDEIGLSPVWFTSFWSVYYVWTLTNNQWIYAVSPFPTHNSQFEEGIIPIEIDISKEGNVLIRYTQIDMDDLEMKTKTKSIPIN